MNTTRKIEILVGLFVAGGLAALFMLAMQVSNLSSIGSVTDAKSIRLVALFDNIGGLKVRSPVTMSGVRIGRVTSIVYDPDYFQARVEMQIEAQYDYLPIDSSASIYTAGLLGEQYIAVEPGAEEAFLTQGDRIEMTQSAMVLEELIGQVMVNLTSE